MNSKEVKIVLNNYLDTVPEIHSCRVCIDIGGIYLRNINKTNFTIESDYESKEVILNEEHFSIMMEHNFKQILAQIIFEKLNEVNSILYEGAILTLNWEYIKPIR